jgi:hypothetical protein
MRKLLLLLGLVTATLLSGCYSTAGYYAPAPRPYYRTGYYGGGYYQSPSYGYGGGGYVAPAPVYSRPAYVAPVYSRPAYVAPVYSRPAYVAPARGWAVRVR